MKKRVIRTAGRAGSFGAAEQKFSVPIMLSFMGHVVFCLLFIGLPRFGSFDTPTTRVINVQLRPEIALPQASTPAPDIKTPEPEAAPPPAPKPEPVVASKPETKETVSLSPKNKIEKKRSMKHRTYKRERVVESAIKNIEKRVESSRPDPIRQALDQIQANLKAEENNDSQKGTGISGKGKPSSDVELAYIADIVVSINRNWAFNDQMAGGEKNLYNLVVIEIRRNGEIKDVWFDRRSGNNYFDESTRKAILKSNPLPPLPKEIPGSSKEVGFRFIPEGIK